MRLHFGSKSATQNGRLMQKYDGDEEGEVVSERVNLGQDEKFTVSHPSDEGGRPWPQFVFVPFQRRGGGRAQHLILLKLSNDTFSPQEHHRSRRIRATYQHIQQVRTSGKG